MICYYITKEEINLPPSSRLEISGYNRTTSFHHTPLLYRTSHQPNVKSTFLFITTKLVKSTGRREKATYAATVYLAYIEQVSCFLTKYNGSYNEFS